MTTTRLSNALQHVRSVLARRESDGSTDGELLDRFLAHRDEDAFAELVRRHGPMVLGVCRRVLCNPHDADDAFQATFLVLVRRAATVRPRSAVGNFLYGVAYRTAREARRAAARRREKEARVMPPSEPAENTWAELRPVLDQELSRLPDRYRIPVVLCDLEGRTRKEAADQLGWPEGTVSSRLSRARVILARRLIHHGLTLSGGAVAAALAQGSAMASVPAPLAVSTVKAAMLVAAGQAVSAGPIGAGATALTERMVRAMQGMKFSFAAAVLLAAGVLGIAAYQALAEGREKGRQPVAAQPARAVAGAASGDEKKPSGKEEKGAAVSVKELPPVVVRTVPQAGDTRVDAAKVTEIRATFSKEMADKSWSWAQISDETFPKVVGDIRYDKGQRTCVLPVKLQPGKTYVLWLNSEKFNNFKDADGRAAVPYLLVFQTKP